MLFVYSFFNFKWGLFIYYLFSKFYLNIYFVLSFGLGYGIFKVKKIQVLFLKSSYNDKFMDK